MGIVRFITNKIEVIAAKNAAIEAAMEAVGIEAEKYAKLHLDQEPRRIDTGRLRNSIAHTVKKDSAYIGTNVEYAIYVEFGTKRMAPNHFLKSAAADHTERYMTIFKNQLKNN